MPMSSLDDISYPISLIENNSLSQQEAMVNHVEMLST